MRRRHKPAGTYPRHPIFALLRERGLMLIWLALQTGYSQVHVRAVAAGIANASPEFRRRCAAALGLPESQLFLTDHGASGASRPEDASADGSDTQDDGTALGHTAYAAAGGAA